MKFINKFVALGLGISIAFTGSNFIYAYFSDMAKQNNTIKFKTKPVVLGVDTQKNQYITYKGNQIIKFKGMLKHNSNLEFRELYSGEKLVLEITPDSEEIFKGATISYYTVNNQEQSGYIEMVKKKFYQLGDWNIIGDKQTVGIRASIVGLDGKKRSAWVDGKDVRYFSVELRGYTTSGIDPGKVNIVEVKGPGYKLDKEKEDEVEPPKEEVEVPSEPGVVEPPKEEVEVPSKPDVVEPPKEEVEVPSEPDVVEPPKEEVEVPSEPDVVEPPKEEETVVPNKPDLTAPSKEEIKVQK